MDTPALQDTVREQTRFFLQFLRMCLSYVASFAAVIALLLLLRLLLPRGGVNDPAVGWILVVFYGALHVLFFVHILAFWWRQEFPRRPKAGPQ